MAGGTTLLAVPNVQPHYARDGSSRQLRLGEGSSLIDRLGSIPRQSLLIAQVRRPYYGQ